MNQKLILDTQKLALTTLMAAALLAPAAHAAETDATKAAAASASPPVFAQVGEIAITWRDYNNAYATASRSRFYHGKPPEGEIAALQREIADKLVTDALLLNEAKRIKLKPDAAAVKEKVDAYDQRNSSSEQWQQIRERALPVITKRYENEDLLSQLAKKVRTVPTPSDKQLRSFYDSNPDKFTEPEQLRVSVILLSVDPGVGDFDAKRKQAEDLVKQLRAGADFAEMAKLHSGDLETKDQGGDMGYQHGGMLSETSQQAIDKLKPGEISDPVGLMEGIAIFKLTERQQAKLNSFDAVRDRAQELYLTTEGERAWKSLIAQLKKKTHVKMDESKFLPLPKPAQK